MLVEFKKEFVLGRSESRAQAEAVGPGDKRNLPNWQATELADRQICKILGDDRKAPPVHSEEYVRERLGRMEKARVLGKLENRGVKVPKGLDKAGLVDLYVSEVDPGKAAEAPKKLKGKGGGG